MHSRLKKQPDEGTLTAAAKLVDAGRRTALLLTELLISVEFE
jgi:hypothetical protein